MSDQRPTCMILTPLEAGILHRIGDRHTSSNTDLPGRRPIEILNTYIRINLYINYKLSLILKVGGHFLRLNLNGLHVARSPNYMNFLAGHDTCFLKI